MRFSQNEDGFGGRIGVGGFSLSDGFGSRASIFTIPVGLNYLLGKDGKNYFEIGAGFTYLGGSSKDELAQIILTPVSETLRSDIV